MQDDDKLETREAASEEAGPEETDGREAAPDDGVPPTPIEDEVETAGGAGTEAAADDAAPPGEGGDPASDGSEQDVTVEEAADVELAAIEFLESQLEALKAELGARSEELIQAQTALTVSQEARARLQADFDNWRKRQEREVERLQDERVEKVLLKVLPVYDTFGRAIDQYEKDNSEDALYDGLQRIEKMFQLLLEQMGITAMEAAGKPFDPNIHDAVCRVAIPDDGFDDMVVDVFETGYLLGEKVLKPAKVSVAKED